ncbi:hypothetical protein IFM89_030875 [Coptis chinensis]|uniref:Uncharacterized protein n=1 Tax=Coptis chinensis TaxID=261450 RepID=A0A835IFC6_9MAGN|nr:hypothetical protein IFM89_030875 [Coptis chinensis]
MGKIDRALYSAEWSLKYPAWSYKVLCRLCSDHTPLIRWHENYQKSRNASFRFHNMWTTHPRFMDLAWNKLVFGKLETRIKDESTKLERLQLEFQSHTNNEDLAVEVVNQDFAVEALLEQEEQMWK